MANSSCTGGRRRRKTSKKPKKGGYYSFSGGIAPGAALWTPKSEMGPYAISNRGGNTQYGMGRRRKGKGKKKTRKTMRGGSKYGVVSAGFYGDGNRGLANVHGSSDNKPGFASMGGFNDNGAHSLANRSNFITTSM